MACGFAPAAIDDMPMQDVLALLAYWREYPPAHEVLAVVCGVRVAPAPSRDDPSGIGPLMARSPSPAGGRRWPLRQQGSDEGSRA